MEAPFLRHVAVNHDTDTLCGVMERRWGWWRLNSVFLFLLVGLVDIRVDMYAMSLLHKRAI